MKGRGGNGVSGWVGPEACKRLGKERRGEPSEQGSEERAARGSGKQLGTAPATHITRPFLFSL